MENYKNIIIATDEIAPEAIEVPVLKVFDGDGFLTRIRINKRNLFGSELSEIEMPVRFGFIDAPEIGQPGGVEAKDFLESLIAGRSVWIDVLTKMDTGSSFDKYRRLVCVPYIVEEYDSCILKTKLGGYHLSCQFGASIVVARNIELEMVLNGYAWVMERYGPDSRYLHALADARSNKRGIWASEKNENPWDFKRRRASQRR
jgi:endonuclease YncB( thermonuclease family)